MSRTHKKSHALICVGCEKNFLGYRPTDRFCSSSCRWRWKDQQPGRKEKKLAHMKKWSEENFDHKRNYMLKYTYGITQEQYEQLLEQQGGGCAICGKTAEEEGRNLAVDHDHTTMEIIGILCSFCNRNLVGRIREPVAFKRAAEYLENGTGWFVPKKKPRPRKRKPKRK